MVAFILVFLLKEVYERSLVMNYKYVIIGLLISVFALPANDNLVFAGKKCKREKSNIRTEKSEQLSSLCGSVLSKYETFNSFSNRGDPYNRNTLKPYQEWVRTERNGTNSYKDVSWPDIIIPFCEQPSVNTSVKGKAWGCGKQKDYIRSKYNSQITKVEDWERDIIRQLGLKKEEKRYLQNRDNEIMINQAECGGSQCGTWYRNEKTGAVSIVGNSGPKRTCVHPDRSKAWIDRMNNGEYKEVGKSIDDLPICQP